MIAKLYCKKPITVYSVSGTADEADYDEEIVFPSHHFTLGGVVHPGIPFKDYIVFPIGSFSFEEEKSYPFKLKIWYGPEEPCVSTFKVKFVSAGSPIKAPEKPKPKPRGERKK